jgi:hypothetical protein
MWISMQASGVASQLEKSGTRFRDRKWIIAHVGLKDELVNGDSAKHALSHFSLCPGWYVASH